MGSFFARLLLLTILFLSNHLAAEETFKVVGYYPSWALYRKPPFTPKDINPDVLTHVNYAFAKVSKSGDVSPMDPFADVGEDSDREGGNFQELTALKKAHPALKTLISIGGADDSETFSAIASDPFLRLHFAKSAADFCKMHGFDGIDIDWEFPKHGELDKQNFTLMIKALSHAAKQQDPPLLLTLAAPASPWHYESIALKEIQESVDWFNLMSYDFHGAWNNEDNTLTNHHAALYPTIVGSNKFNVNAAVAYYLSQDVPREKIVVGLPLYGRAYQAAHNTPTGLFSQYKGPSKVRMFSELKKSTNQSHKLFWDGIAQAPYLYNMDTGEFISYDNEKSLKIKAKWIRDLGLGGAMVWELGSDVHPTWDAMHVIWDELGTTHDSN